MAEIALLFFVVSLVLLASPSTQLFGALGLLALTVIFPWVFVGRHMQNVRYRAISGLQMKA